MKQKEDMNNVTNLKNDRIFIKEGLTKYLSCSVVFCGWAQQNKCENSSSLIAVTKKINYLKASRWNTQEFIFAFLFHFRKGIENCQLKVMKNCWQLTMIDFFYRLLNRIFQHKYVHGFWGKHLIFCLEFSGSFEICICFWRMLLLLNSDKEDGQYWDDKSISCLLNINWYCCLIYEYEFTFRG